MKSFTLAILAVFYLVISVGFINYNAYCQNRLMQTSMVINKHDCDTCLNCANKKCKKDGNCCKHKTEYIQLKVDQDSSSNHAVDLTPQQFVLLDIFLSGGFLPDTCDTSQETYPVTNAPPIGGQSPIHILNCTYLI